MPRQRTVKLSAPYLRKVLLVPERVERWQDYPFCLPLFRQKSFEMEFDDAVTIIVGENGVGKSTLFEGIAENAGFGLAGGSRDHGGATRVDEASLAKALKLAWLPKVTRGYFFRAETFFSLARYMIDAAKDDPCGGPPPDWLDAGCAIRHLQRSPRVAAAPASCSPQTTELRSTCSSPALEVR
jgi:predicted ATPase